MQVVTAEPENSDADTTPQRPSRIWTRTVRSMKHSAAQIAVVLFGGMKLAGPSSWWQFMLLFMYAVLYNGVGRDSNLVGLARTAWKCAIRLY